MNMLGVVLAGGLSRRMGADKANLLLDGEPLWRRQMGVLRAAGLGRVVLMRRTGQTAPPGVECWRDVPDAIGPLGGIHTALLARVAPWVAVLAVDMPGIRAEWFTWLAGFCRSGIGAAAQHAEGVEPLAGIYPADAVADAASQIGAGDFSVRNMIRTLAHSGRMTLVPIGAAETECVRSLNTPSESDLWGSRRERFISTTIVRPRDISRSPSTR
ncbi:MAG: molybdenum cofactor guanylyltransferase [Opitutaceae bacterium]|jgi:molybdopterin-guanine dinucleotide biosynthesis protein A